MPNTTLHFDLSLDEYLRSFASRSTFCLTEPQVFGLYEHKFQAQAQTFGQGTYVLSFRGKWGEEHKRWESCARVIEVLLNANVDRQGCLVVVGGGLLTDLGAFVASIYLRGIDVVLVPTTLLAMVDAAVGGKNGINVKGYKNVIGTIRLPSAIVWDYDFLRTLPQTVWAEGFAEIIKYACILDKTLFSELQKQGSLAAYQQDKATLDKLIRRCVKLKNKVVSADLLEKGKERKKLNFGHTLGHIMELALRISHGEAVACGMVFSTWLSIRKGILAKEELQRVVTLLKSYGLLTTSMERWSDVDVGHLNKDKKRNSQHIDFVCLKEVGQAVVVPMSLSELKKDWSSFLAERTQLLAEQK